MFDQVSIQKLSNKEMIVGRNIVSVLENNIIHVVAIGEQTTLIALAQDRINRQLSNTIKGRINYLVDLNQAGKNSPEARGLWKKVVEEKSTKKVALYGLNPVARVLAQFVMAITHEGRIRFFKTKEEGLKWITH